MKIITALFLLTGSVTANAQPRLITTAMVTTKTTIISPENDEQQMPTNTSGPGGEEIRMIRFGGDGETKTTTWLKNDLTKTFSESEMGRTTVIRDNAKKITTTIMEMMGRKTGFYATDEEQAAMRKQMDSMMRSRSQGNNTFFSNTPPSWRFEYLEDSKKLAGYACKKSLLIGTRSDGRSDTTVVWYCPDFKLQGLPSTGGSAGGFGGFNQVSGIDGMENLNGFPMQYERNMRNGRKMTVLVSKLDIDKEITDKEFEIPKDITVKPIKEMQNGGGPGFQIRIAGQ